MRGNIKITKETNESYRKTTHRDSGGSEVTVAGPKGSLVVPVQPRTKVSVDGATLTVTREDDEP